MEQERVNDWPTQEAFVKAWLLSKTYAELSKRIGMTVSQCYQRGYRMRRCGVQLPKLLTKLGTQKEAVNTAKLNKLIDKFTVTNRL